VIRMGDVDQSFDPGGWTKDRVKIKRTITQSMKL
jgi:hypothetical protein